jgi:hypothetical protein
MTVSELIAELQKMPPDMRVVSYVEVPGGWADIEAIEIGPLFGENADAVFVG